MIYLYYTKLVSFCQQFFSHNDKICDFSLQNETPKPCLSIKYSQKKCFCPTGQKHFLSALGDDLDLAETSLGKILRCHAGARGKAYEIFGINRIERRKICDIRKEAGRLYDVFKA